MRINHVIAVAFILVLVGVKLAFFAAPVADAGSRSLESGSVDVSWMQQNIKSLPVQKFHDMSFVFPSPT